MQQLRQMRGEPAQVTPIEIAGMIAKVIPTFEPREVDAVNRLFADERSTEATLRHLISGPGSDHLPDLRELREAAMANSLAGRVTELVANFTRAVGRLKPDELERLTDVLADPKRAERALKSMIKQAFSK
jgi:hypothetical protein